MCIFFIAISDQPQKDGFKIIIAGNRDESFERPTQEAHFWKDYPHILSGKLSSIYTKGRIPDSLKFLNLVEWSVRLC